MSHSCINDADLKATTVTMGGASVLPTTRTIPHWHGQTKDPSNGVTYGYNMVGADPNTCSGRGCDVTIQVDITPINVNVGGQDLRRQRRAAADPRVAAVRRQRLRHHPGRDGGRRVPAGPSSSGGPAAPLSQGDAGVPLQLQDATMRAQFNKTGASSNYHLQPASQRAARR